MPDCAADPSDPVCQEFYDRATNSNPTTPTYNQYVLEKYAGMQFHPSTPIEQTGVGTDKIVTTTGPAASIGSWWTRIPTWVKWIGAGVLAYAGYKRFVAKPKPAGVSGLGWGRRRRR